MHSLRLLVACTLVGCGGAQFFPATDAAEDSGAALMEGDADPPPPAPPDDAAPTSVDADHVGVRDDAARAPAADAGEPPDGAPEASSPLYGADGGCLDEAPDTFVGVGTLGGMVNSSDVPTPKACRCAATYTCDCVAAETNFCSVAGKAIGSCVVRTDGVIAITCAQ